MIRRITFIALVGLSCAGCGMVGSSSTNPSLVGRDALGKQVYSLGGDRLGNLEATANSYCPGVTRPYYRTVAGSGDDMQMTYTCE